MLRIITLLLLVAVSFAEEASLLYEKLYQISKQFSGQIVFMFTCDVQTESELTLTISVGDNTVDSIKVPTNGVVQLPMNEDWLKGNAIVRANRPKGTMTLNAKLIAYDFSNFKLTNGTADLTEFVQRMEWARANYVGLIKKLGVKMEYYENYDNWVINSKSNSEFSAVINYTSNKEVKVLSRKSINGKLCINLKSLYGSDHIELKIDPIDADLSFNCEVSERVDVGDLFP